MRVLSLEALIPRLQHRTTIDMQGARTAPRLSLTEQALGKNGTNGIGLRGRQLSLYVINCDSHRLLRASEVLPVFERIIRQPDVFQITMYDLTGRELNLRLPRDVKIAKAEVEMALSALRAQLPGCEVRDEARRS